MHEKEVSIATHDDSLQNLFNHFSSLYIYTPYGPKQTLHLYVSVYLEIVLPLKWLFPPFTKNHISTKTLHADVKLSYIHNFFFILLTIKFFLLPC